MTIRQGSSVDIFFICLSSRNQLDGTKMTISQEHISRQLVKQKSSIRETFALWINSSTTIIVDRFVVNIVLIENFFDDTRFCLVDLHNCEQMESIRMFA